MENKKIEFKTLKDIKGLKPSHRIAIRLVTVKWIKEIRKIKENETGEISGLQVDNYPWEQDDISPMIRVLKYFHNIIEEDLNG